MDQQTRSEPLKIHWISTTDSTEFTHFARVLTRSSVIGLDAEWKPVRGPTSSFPTVSILQLACQLKDKEEEIEVFLLDLSTLHLPSIWKLLTDMFVSPDILKLGFRFKQDLVYLDSTFVAHGCDSGFNQVYPYMDIVDIHHHLQHKNKQVVGRKMLKEIKSLAAICKDVLGISLSKELQCSDWSDRPLTEEQKIYAAIDAECLIRIFKVFFHSNATKEGKSSTNMIIQSSIVNRGLKEILERHDNGYELKTIKSVEALDIIQATFSCEQSLRLANVHGMVPKTSLRSTMPMDESLSRIVREFGKKILLVGSDRKPKATKKKGKKKPSSALICKVKLDIDGDWQGPPPWDVSFGGDGCPKFLCDVMVEGLAKHLRCVGIDAAIPYSKKPGARELIDQAYKEHRVLLTRDAKLLKHQYSINNQVYRVKNLLKNEQLTEVIETFQLKISENQLMSRCTKCNGRFIQKPLSTEEAVEAAKGFQKIPSCLFDKNLEFWQCRDCKQLYWEGTQYHNAVQKFIDVCKLN